MINSPAINNISVKKCKEINYYKANYHGCLTQTTRLNAAANSY